MESDSGRVPEPVSKAVRILRGLSFDYSALRHIPGQPPARRKHRDLESWTFLMLSSRGPGPGTFNPGTGVRISVASPSCMGLVYRAHAGLQNLAERVRLLHGMPFYSGENEIQTGLISLFALVRLQPPLPFFAATDGMSRWVS